MVALTIWFSSSRVPSTPGDTQPPSCEVSWDGAASGRTAAEGAPLYQRWWGCPDCDSSIGQDIGVHKMILKVWCEGYQARMWVSASKVRTQNRFYHILSKFIQVHRKSVMTPEPKKSHEAWKMEFLSPPSTLHHPLPPFWRLTRLKLRRRIEILNWRSSELKGPRPPAGDEF